MANLYAAFLHNCHISCLILFKEGQTDIVFVRHDLKRFNGVVGCIAQTPDLVFESDEKKTNTWWQKKIDSVSSARNERLTLDEWQHQEAPEAVEENARLTFISKILKRTWFWQYFVSYLHGKYNFMCKLWVIFHFPFFSMNCSIDETDKLAGTVLYSIFCPPRL